MTEIVEKEGAIYVKMKRGPDLIFTAGGYGIVDSSRKPARSSRRKEDPKE